MSFNYISYRKTKRSGKYKLRKRTQKILEMIRSFKNQSLLSILDVGAADGLMLNQFKNNLKTSICLGIEPSLEFIRSRSDNSCMIIQAVGESLPLKKDVFDVITAASVLDHMENPSIFLRESHKVLKKNGIIIISFVSPVYDKLAVRFKLKEDDHLFHFTEGKITGILRKEGFNILKISRFALPFFGIHFEEFIENVFNTIGMKWMMFYIVAVARVRK
ncbi:MAG: class I SAM-dependent methyltransferase [Desulfobacterales bacterium]|nr:class I SAM-dependent methyltransferase [Desulfobacterales bacterium]